MRCNIEPALPATSQHNMKRYEHTTAVLHFEKKGFAMTRKDVLQGLSEDSSNLLFKFGEDGWELVAALPFTTGGAGLFSSAATGTDAALAFFKRSKD